jgi:uncharacterized UPF0160 family protein
MNIVQPDCAITHPGIFHADDIVATAMLCMCRLVTKDNMFRYPEVKRSQLEDPNVIVFDTGGKHNPALNNYDHHQNKKSDAACVLLFDGLGLGDPGMLPLAGPEAASRFRTRFLKPISNVDVYGCDRTDIFSLNRSIASFNPHKSSHNKGDAFWKAVEWTEQLISVYIQKVNRWVRTEALFKNASLVCNNNAMLLCSKPDIWWDHCGSLDKDIKYLIYPIGEGGYYISAVPISPGNVQARRPFPKGWSSISAKDMADMYKLKYTSQLFFHKNSLLCGTGYLHDAFTIVNAALAD